MSERDTRAYVIGKRYDCDECGAEMSRDPARQLILASDPPQYPHICENGHTANLSRSYPGYVVVNTNEPHIIAGGLA